MLITSSAERNAKYRREQELKRAMLALGNPTVDQKYITDFGNSASKFISDSAKGVSGVAFGQSQQALDRYNAQAQRLKYQKLVIEDFLERNAEKGSYTELQNALNNIQKGIDNVGNAYINTHNMMSQYKTEDEYNRDKITSQHVGSTYDEILAEINRLGEEQKKQTPEQAAKTQKSRDVLNNLLYSAEYGDAASYSKAKADLDRQIAYLKGEVSKLEKSKGKGLVGETRWDLSESGKQYDSLKQKLEIAEIRKETLEQRERLFKREQEVKGYEKHKTDPYFMPLSEAGRFNYSIPIKDTLEATAAEYDKLNNEGTNRIAFFFDLLEKFPELKDKNVSDIIGGHSKLNDLVNDSKNENWQFMSENERDIYNYLFEVFGAQEAEKYFDKLKPFIDKRGMEDDYKKQKAEYDSANFFEKLWMNVESVPQNIIGGIGAGIEDLGSLAFTGEVNPYSPAHDLQSIATNTRGMTAESIGKWAGEWGANTYQALMSGLDSFVGSLTLGQVGKGIQVAGKTINLVNGYGVAMGLGTLSQKAEELYERGATIGQIATGSIVSGVIEVLFETFSAELLLSGLGDVTSFSGFLKKVLIQGGVEASEEFNTEVANIVADSLITGYGSADSNKINQYLSLGMTLEEAKNKANLDNIKSVFWAAYSGFISGGASSSVAAGVSLASNKSAQKKSYSDLGISIKEYGDVQELYNYAVGLESNEISRIVGSASSAKSLSDEKIGRMYEAVHKDIVNALSNADSLQALTSAADDIYNSTSSDIVKETVSAVYRQQIALNFEKWGFGNMAESETTVDVDGVVDDSAGGVEAAEESVLPNVSAVAPEADPIKDDAFAARGLERLTEEQRFLKSIGETLGRKVEFQNLDKWVKDPETGKRRRVSPGGMINKTTGVLYLNSSKYANQNALREVLKHEIMHFAEVDADAYALLQKGIMDSQVFNDWVKRKGYKGTVNEDGYAVSATSNMNAAYIKRYAESGLEGTEVFKGKDAEDAANREMVADFVAENLFTDDMSRLRDALSDVQPEMVNKFKQWILDLLKKLKNAFRSQAKVYESIEGIEREFVKVCKSAQRIWEQNHQQTSEQQKTSTESGGQYSFADDGVGYSANSGLDKYWYPAMSRKDIEYVKRRAKYELNTTENYIDNLNKWLYNEKDGKVYFALYSTENADAPTVLYACKGNRADFEHEFLTQYFDEKVIDDEGIHERTKIIDQILKDYGNVYGDGTTNRRNVVGRGSNGGNVTVHRKNSRNRPSEALLNCLRNIKEISERNRAGLNKSAFSMPETRQYSLPQEVEEEYEGHRQKALELFGTTNDFRVTGFTLPDGKTLKLSKYGVLGTQHRLIEAVYDDLKGDKAINQFIQEGNVRIKAAAPGIEIGEKIAPTVSQLNTVARLIRQELYKRGVFYLDITAENGDSIASVEYTEDDTIEDIFYDIKAYYERGRVPTTSSINVSWYSQFAYSLPEAMSQFDALPFAKEIVEKYGKTTMSTDDIAIEMGKALSSISHGQWAHAFQIAQEIAETFEGNKTKTITNAIYNGLVRERESFLQDRAVSKPKERLASEREENRDLKKSKKSLEEKVKRRDNTLASIEIKHVVTEDRRKNIGHFHSVYNRLATRLKGNTDAKHIPEHLKGFVASFLEIFDLKSAVVDGTRVRKTFTSKDIAKFIREYTNTETDNFGTPNMAYDESIKEFLEYLYDKADTEDGVSVPELDAYDIMMLSNLADNVMQIVKMSEETFRNGRAIEFEELSDPCFADLKDKKQKTGWRNAAADWFRNLAQKNMTPPYFFKQLGEGFYRLYNDIVKGQGQWAVNFKKAQEFVKELKNKYNYEKWNKSSVTLKTERGDSIKLTIEQAMQLYATFKRQVSNTDQDAQHLNIGGIVLEDAISTSNWDKIKSDLDSIKNNSEFDEGTKKKKLQEVWNAFHEQYDSNAVPLTDNDLMSVQTLLSEDQKGYADGWVRYLSNNMAELGNQTSMMLFGYEKFHEQNYIPYNSAENYLYSQPGMATGGERIKHLSFTKNTIKGAATPLVLSSLSEVCASHVDKMCTYNAMAIPLENLNRVFNCKHYAEDGSVTAKLRNDISKTFGPEAVKYLRQFIEDANGSVRGSSDEGFWDSLTSKFKKSAVLASMSVVIQQPSAMYRAMAYINPKYFTKLKDVKGFRKNYEQLCKYAPVALIKQMGRFDTGVGVGNVKWLLQDETLMDKLDDKASFLASYADEVTWGHIWTAVKAEAAAETDLQVGSEEFFKYCGQRFTEVINLTQVYDSTLVKSQHMRNKSTLAKMITSFMAEPTVTYNIIADALYRAKTEGKSGKKFAGRAVGAVLTSIIANVLLKSLVYAARDDEEDKNLIENYFKQVTQNFVYELNPFGFVPYFRDISSLWQGYDVNRADTTLIGDLINAIKSLPSENTSAFDKIEKLSGAIANAFGVPVRNVVRDIKAVINGVTSIFDNPVSLEGIKYAQKEGLSEAVEKVTGGLIDKDEVFSYYGRMVEAIEDGDEETYNEIYDLLIENGVSEDDIISEIKKAASVSRDVNQQVSSYVGEISRTSTYKSFDDEDRKKLKSKIQEALGVQKLDDIIPGSDSQFDKLYQAKRNNNTTYKKLKKQLIDRGLTENEIQLKLFLAELRYIESKGIDIHEWALAEIAKSKKYADTDGSGGVTKKESYQAIKNLDVDTKAINALIDYYKLK